MLNTIYFLLITSLACFAGSFGTGFVISNEGHIITCEHCVEGATQISVLIDGYSHEARILFVDKKQDIACLKIDKKTPSYLGIADSDLLKPLDDLYVFGYPLPSTIGSELSASKGSFNAARELFGRSLLQIDAVVNPGNSGGPVIDANGQVIGIAVLKVVGAKGNPEIIPERINLAVPSKILKEKLKVKGIGFQTKRVKRDFNELRSLATSSTVQIIAMDAAPAENDKATEELDGRPNFHTAGEFNVMEVAKHYIEDGSLDNVEGELSYYAPKVDYYGKGIKDLKYIKADLTELNTKWKERIYKVTDFNSVNVDREKQIASVNLSYKYSLFNGKKHYSGVGTSLLVFDISGEQHKVVLVREHRKRN